MTTIDRASVIVLVMIPGASAVEVLTGNPVIIVPLDTAAHAPALVLLL